MKILITLMLLLSTSALASPVDGIWTGEGVMITSGGEYIDCDYRFKWEQLGNRLFRYKTNAQCEDDLVEFDEFVLRIMRGIIVYNGKRVGLMDDYGFDYNVTVGGRRITFSLYMTEEPGIAKYTEFRETGNGTVTHTGFLRNY